MQSLRLNQHTALLTLIQVLILKLIISIKSNLIPVFSSTLVTQYKFLIMFVNEQTFKFANDNLHDNKQ